MNMTATMTAASVFTAARRVQRCPAALPQTRPTDLRVPPLVMAATILRQRPEPRLDLLAGAPVHDEPEVRHPRQRRERTLRVRRDRRLVPLGVERLVAFTGEHQQRPAYG